MLYWQNRRLQQSFRMIGEKQILQSLSEYYINKDHTASVFCSGLLLVAV